MRIIISERLPKYKSGFLCFPLSANINLICTYQVKICIAMNIARLLLCLVYIIQTLLEYTIVQLRLRFM